MKVEILALCRKAGSIGFGAEWRKVRVDLPEVNDNAARLAVYAAGYEHIFRIRWRELPEGEEQMSEYRTLTVKSVQRLPSRYINLKFDESSIELAVAGSHSFSARLDDLSVGDKIEIKGRLGNSDADLWGINAVVDIRVPGGRQ